MLLRINILDWEIRVFHMEMKLLFLLCRDVITMVDMVDALVNNLLLVKHGKAGPNCQTLPHFLPGP